MHIYSTCQLSVNLHPTFTRKSDIEISCWLSGSAGLFEDILSAIPGPINDVNVSSVKFKKNKLLSVSDKIRSILRYE